MERNRISTGDLLLTPPPPPPPAAPLVVPGVFLCLNVIFFALFFPIGHWNGGDSGSMECAENTVANAFTTQNMRASSGGGTTTRIADAVVTSAYRETYALLSECPPEVSEKSCLERIYLKKSASTIPWWFRTLLRDGGHRGKGLHGWWHTLEMMSDPPLRLCAIEKIGTTSWRKATCGVNGMRYRGVPCKLNSTQRTSAARRSSSWPRVVFVRDPLERLLSAFLDKCVNEKKRKNERHCEPNLLFMNQTEGSESAQLTEGVVDRKREYFDMFLHAMPLFWNVHFMPQGLFCDGLRRRLGEYDFVGTMGPDFNNDLRELAGRFGNKRFNETLGQVFNVSLSAEQPGASASMSTPKHTGEYYSPRTVRRALEYLSLDYVTLNLSVPEWAHRMLEEDRVRREGSS